MNPGHCPECLRPFDVCATGNAKVAPKYQCGAGPLPAGTPGLPGAARRNQDSNAMKTRWRDVWADMGLTPTTPDPNERNTGR